MNENREERPSLAKVDNGVYIIETSPSMLEPRHLKRSEKALILANGRAIIEKNTQALAELSGQYNLLDKANFENGTSEFELNESAKAELEQEIGVLQGQRDMLRAYLLTQIEHSKPCRIARKKYNSSNSAYLQDVTERTPVDLKAHCKLVYDLTEGTSQEVTMARLTDLFSKHASLRLLNEMDNADFGRTK